MPPPYILAETEDFAVVFKPPRMHCAPLRQDARADGKTLLDWYGRKFPAVWELSGRKEGEGGLLHRLDFETNGLVLFAKNQKSLDHLLDQQEQGSFVKEYSAICLTTFPQNAGFPPPPFPASTPHSPLIIESYFRPFGPGRKQVRPLAQENSKGREIAKDHGGMYRTEIIHSEKRDNFCFFAIRLKRGFRHQIRCHLAWIGCPVMNDPLYGMPGSGSLALRAHGLSFGDPQSGEARVYRIAPLETPQNTM